MAGNLTRYGGSLGALRRSYSSNLPPVGASSHTVYFVCDNPIEEGQFPLEYRNTKFPAKSEFPLPGKQASQYQYRVSKLPRRKTESWRECSDVMSAELRDQVQLAKVAGFLGPPGASEAGERSLEDVVGGMAVRLEASAQALPSILVRDFASLFPGQALRSVVTLVQGTEADMSAWSPTMEAERDALTADFIAVATRAVVELTKAGHWADFVDPSSGRPYLGPFTPATLFETDERYANFGFAIEDLGCCKVVSHPLWGTKMFLGSIFTSAPVDSPEVQSILAKANATRNSS